MFYSLFAFCDAKVQKKIDICKYFFQKLLELFVYVKKSS